MNLFVFQLGRALTPLEDLLRMLRSETPRRKIHTPTWLESISSRVHSYTIAKFGHNFPIRLPFVIGGRYDNRAEFEDRPIPAINCLLCIRVGGILLSYNV